MSELFRRTCEREFAHVTGIDGSSRLGAVLRALDGQWVDPGELGYDLACQHIAFVADASPSLFSDGAQNVFSENGVTQWGFVWGRFMDHTFGLRQDVGGELRPLAFDAGDPLEEFVNTVGGIPFSRAPAAPGTGVGWTVGRQINTVSSYIDGFNVYGGAEARLERLSRGTGRRRPVEQRRPPAAGGGRAAAAPRRTLNTAIDGQDNVFEVEPE